MRILAVDPGKHLVGAAIYIDGAFEWADCIEFDNRADLYYYFSASPEYASIWSKGGTFDAVVCEVPRVYPGKQRENPDDLIDVALTAGVILALHPKAIAVRPNAWKGSIPKDKHHRRLLPTLTDKEHRAIADVKKSIRHNVIDAIGLARWYLGRSNGY